MPVLCKGNCGNNAVLKVRSSLLNEFQNDLTKYISSVQKLVTTSVKNVFFTPSKQKSTTQSSKEIYLKKDN